MEKAKTMTMSDFISKAEGILAHMESQREMYDSQLKMYKEAIDNSMALHRERMLAFEKRQDEQDSRWAGLRNTVWIAISILFIVVLSGGIAINSAVTTDELDAFEKQMNEDYFDKGTVLQGMGVLIDGVYESLETNGADRNLSHEEKQNLKERVIGEMMPEYATRTVKQVQ